MKKIISLLVGLCFAGTIFAQTLNINEGNVTYAIPADQMGEAVVSGSSFTIGKKTYDTSSITNIAVDETAVTDNTVSVNYDGSDAKVVIAGNIAHLVTAKVSGAHVTLLQSADVTDEITYTLSGTSNDGSFYMDGDLKATVVLNSVSLVNPDSAAINIQDGKRICISINGINSLTDGITGTSDGTDAHNACFYVNGHSEFEGDGWLYLYGKVKHAYTSDEYTKFKKSMAASILVYEAVGDGMHIGQYFQMNGGNAYIECQGDGIDVGSKNDTSLENNGQILINGGAVQIATDGASGDAMKCEGAFTMTDGDLYLLALGKGGRAISADGDVSISGGSVYGAACGAINTADDDRKAHGIKTDGNITVSGGEVRIAASSDKGVAFKTDNKVNFTGGTVMGIGGKKTTSTTNTSTYYSGVNIVGTQEVTYDGVTFKVPSQYNNSSAYIIVAKN